MKPNNRDATWICFHAMRPLSISGVRVSFGLGLMLRFFAVSSHAVIIQFHALGIGLVFGLGWLEVTKFLEST